MIILTQTDTTVGFLSQDAKALQNIKSRPSSKPFIKVYNNFSSLDLRVPKNRRKALRRAKKTTFIVKNQAFRVAKPHLASSYLRARVWQFSTSANESSKSYARDFCEQKADIIIEDKNSLFEGEASKLLKINARKVRRLR